MIRGRFARKQALIRTGKGCYLHSSLWTSHARTIVYIFEQMHSRFNHMHLTFHSNIFYGTSKLTYRQNSNVSRTKSRSLNVSRLVLLLSLPSPLKPGVKSPTGDAPTTSEWSTKDLYLKVYCQNVCTFTRTWPELTTTILDSKQNEVQSFTSWLK